ncbi:MAG: molybdopterin-dependent oxidoreductase [Actinomycetes bacterium]
MRTRAAAVAGLLAGALALGVAELLAALVSPTASPVLAVGGAFVDATPTWLKNFAVETFGTADKLVLLVGIGVVVALLAGVAGVVASRRWAFGALLVVALGVVAAVAAATRPGAGVLDPAPSLLGAAAGLFALRLMLDRLPGSVPHLGSHAARADRDPGRAGEETSDAGRSRRAFLGAAGGTALVAFLSVGAGRLVSGASRSVAAARTALRLPSPAVPAPPLPKGAQAPVAGMPPFVTPADTFYRVDTALLLPEVEASGWRLRVHGMVEREVRLDFQDLMRSDLVEAWVTLCCVSNEVGGPLVDNARWLGLPVRQVLARAGPKAGADMVLSTSADGFTASTPLSVLTDDRNALLAVGMNGRPLPVAHGYPVRMVVPGLYGYVSATKWVVDLQVTRFADRTAYWTDRGWAPRGPVKTMSRIDVPGPSAQVAAGTVAVGGTAWAQHRGISRVEVRVDGGPWQDATLSDDVGVDSWRQWWFRWGAQPGEHRLEVRATDGTGAVQTGDEAAPFPDGASGWHSLTVTVT